MTSRPKPDGTEHSVDVTGVKPVPVRFWWLKRILIVGGIVLLAMAALRLWWGWEAHRRLQAEIDNYVAAGEPIYPKDFDSKWVPDDLKAATFLLDAAAALDVSPEQERLIGALADAPEEINGHLDEVAKIIKANAKSLALLRQARTRQKIERAAPTKGPASNTIEYVFRQPALSEMLGMAVSFYHITGNDAQAIETAADAIAQAEVADMFSSNAWLHAGTLAQRLWLVQSLEFLTPNLMIRPVVSISEETDPLATRAAVASLIKKLLDESPLRRGLVTAMQAERRIQLDRVRLCVSGEASARVLRSYGNIVPPSAWERVETFVFRPRLELDAIRIIRRASAFVDAARQSTWPVALATFPKSPTPESAMRSILPQAGGDRDDYSLFAFHAHFHVLGLTRMAATALAIRLYELDHGRRPEELAQLVPDYLDTVPLDPFADGGRTLGYRPRQPNPVLYCIGENGIDHGGAFTCRGDDIHSEDLDIPFFLDGSRPRRVDPPPAVPPPSPETREDNHYEEHDERDTD